MMEFLKKMLEVVGEWIIELFSFLFRILRYILGEDGSILVICGSFIITTILTGVFAVKFFLKKKYLISTFYFIIFFSLLGFIIMFAMTTATKGFR
ncbi:MAG: hypothetical protein V1773_17030 [bacterium]